MERYFLERIHIRAFGRFFEVTLGPFSRGLNVVYGKNEAGKTTLNAFIRGVLFGWDDARGSKNVYKPASARRAGSLLFAPRGEGEGKSEGAHRVFELERARNANDLEATPKEALALIEDIDKETYTTVFALTTDELRDLKSAGNMTSRLLTAGSGTISSPSGVLEDLDVRIARYTSRAASAVYSFPNLKKRKESCREQLAEARKRSDDFREEDSERRELVVKCDAVARELAQTNADAEMLAALKKEIERLDDRMADAERRRDSAQREAAIREAAVKKTANAGADRLSAADDAALREAIEREQEAQIRAANRLESAQDDFHDARARYDAEKEAAKIKTPKRPMTPFLAAIALAVSGIAWVVAGSWAESGAASAVGFVCLAAAAALAIIMVVRLRAGASRGTGGVEEAQRFMTEKKSILEAREEESKRIDARINELLESANLSEAKGSLRRATELINAAREARIAHDQARSRLDESIRIRDAAAAEARECRRRRSKALVERGFDAAASLEEVDLKATRVAQRRDKLTERLERYSRRLGELNQILSSAERETSLDLLKTEYAQITTLQEESGIELARLLLARRMVADAMHRWESESQPKVYARASDLFSIMTGGAWRAVRVEESGSVRAVDAVGRLWEPRLLSLGTCQQLYLALRIALLECVDSVGTHVPVLADDILVNFDEERRRGAVRALVELSAKRQVIVFTCHKTTADLLVRQAGDCLDLEL